MVGRIGDDAQYELRQSGAMLCCVAESPLE